jgi:hypothetical protein
MDALLVAVVVAAAAAGGDLIAAVQTKVFVSTTGFECPKSESSSMKAISSG